MQVIASGRWTTELTGNYSKQDYTKNGYPVWKKPGQLLYEKEVFIWTCNNMWVVGNDMRGCRVGDIYMYSPYTHHGKGPAEMTGTWLVYDGVDYDKRLGGVYRFGPQGRAATHNRGDFWNKNRRRRQTT